MTECLPHEQDTKKESLHIDAITNEKGNALLKFQADELMRLIKSLVSLMGIAGKDAPWLFEDEGRLRHLTAEVDKLIAVLSALNLHLSTKALTDMRGYIELDSTTPQIRASILDARWKEVYGRIIDELELCSIYFIDSAKSLLLDEGELPFGKEVADRFPNAGSDISEGAKCLGLSRNTACVFHLMRALEEVVRELGKSLSITVLKKDNTELEWGKILANMKVPVEAMSGPSKDQWSEALTLLYHVKNCWRNATMHPKQSYTDEEARDIYNAVNSFMRRVAKLI